MRRFSFGLAAALVTVIMATATGAFAKDPISAEARSAGMKGAPAVVQAAGLDCTVADARLINGDNPDDRFYEVACQNGAGYVLEAKAKTAPISYPCIRLVPVPGAKPGGVTCDLPGNANPALGLKPVLAKAGPACTPSAAKYLGSSGDIDIYEIACPGSPGYILQVPKSGAPVAANCISQSGANDIKCALTDDAAQTSYLTNLVSSKDSGCAVKARRYVGSTPDSNDFYEIACVSGKGYILQTDPTGKLVHTDNCISAAAASIGDGCKLADYRQAMTAENSVYTDLAKKAGFNCAVSQYADFPTATTNPEVVELACSNRPDGGVGVFTNGGPSHVYDCIRSQAEGYKCSFTKEEPVYPRLTAQLQAKGKGSCVVSGARSMGQTATKDDLVEVACADGGPGWVLVYAANSMAPTDLLNCAQVAGNGGGCQLPTNRRK